MKPRDRRIAGRVDVWAVVAQFAPRRSHEEATIAAPDPKPGGKQLARLNSRFILLLLVHSGHKLRWRTVYVEGGRDWSALVSTPAYGESSYRIVYRYASLRAFQSIQKQSNPGNVTIEPAAHTQSWQKQQRRDLLPNHCRGRVA